MFLATIRARWHLPTFKSWLCPLFVRVTSKNEWVLHFFLSASLFEKAWNMIGSWCWIEPKWPSYPAQVTTTVFGGVVSCSSFFGHLRAFMDRCESCDVLVDTSSMEWNILNVNLVGDVIFDNVHVESISLLKIIFPHWKYFKVVLFSCYYSPIV